MTEILKYFEMSVQQQSQMAAAERLYPEWNEKINLISRKDIAFLEEHHLLHSLAIAKVLRFAPGTTL